MAGQDPIAEAAVVQAIENLIASGRRAYNVSVPLEAEQILIARGRGRISQTDALRRVNEAITAMVARGQLQAYDKPYKDWVIVDEVASTPESQANVEWDVFISHASEDKDDFVRPLAHGLEAHGLKVWFDEFTLTVGDSLRRSIDDGLSRSRFGIVVISAAFLHKDWPQRELDGLVAREIGGVKVILPVWHNVTAEMIQKYSPTLADRVAVSSAKGLEHVIAQLRRAIQRGGSDSAAPLRRTSMLQPPHFERETTFEELPVGHLFRFYHRDEMVYGLKVIFKYGNRGNAALALSPTNAGLRPGDLLSACEVQDVVELPNLKIVPSTEPESTTRGAGNIAQPGEIELRGHHLAFVTQTQGDSSVMRVNLQSGEIDHASGARPVEIYSEWSVLRTDGNQTKTLYKHKRARPNKV